MHEFLTTQSFSSVKMYILYFILYNYFRNKSVFLSPIIEKPKILRLICNIYINRNAHVVKSICHYIVLQLLKNRKY